VNGSTGRNVSTKLRKERTLSSLADRTIEPVEKFLCHKHAEYSREYLLKRSLDFIKMHIRNCAVEIDKAKNIDDWESVHFYEARAEALHNSALEIMAGGKFQKRRRGRPKKLPKTAWPIGDVGPDTGVPFPDYTAWRGQED
jgi:hypothetical protein